MQTPEEFVKASLYPEKAFVAVITARDAEWQARVDRLEAALETVQPYFCDPLFHEEHLKRWPMKNRCPTCGLFVADWDAIRAALGRIA